jgi:hypothetical protein
MWMYHSLAAMHASTPSNNVHAAGDARRERAHLYLAAGAPILIDQAKGGRFRLLSLRCAKSEQRAGQERLGFASSRPPDNSAGAPATTSPAAEEALY